MPDTADQQITTPNPATVAASALAQSITDAALDLEKRLVKTYASVADRNTRNPTPTANELSVLSSAPDVVWIYHTGAWRAHPRGSKSVSVNGAGAVKVTGDVNTLIAETTVTDPLGAGVPFMLNIRARTLFSMTAGQQVTHRIRIDGVEAVTAPAVNASRTGVDRVGVTPPLDHTVVKATGGSVTVRSEWDVGTRLDGAAAGDVVTFADARNNFLRVDIHPHWP